jgi:hypothetical protein
MVARAPVIAVTAVVIATVGMTVAAVVASVIAVAIIRTTRDARARQYGDHQHGRCEFHRVVS